jgi:phosphate-selective porin OprO/OprP
MIMKLKLVAALLAGSALIVSAPAYAAQPAPDAPAQPEPTEPDQSDAAADAAIAEAGQVDEAAAKIELLQAQVDGLQASIEQLKGQLVKTTPSWKGAPQWDDKDAGFSFKPRGALQLDAGYVGFPNGHGLNGTVGGLAYNNLGWNSRARRLLIGADGTLPGGFRYSAEFNFAQGTVDYEDIFIAYDFKKLPLTVQVGNIYPFSSLETMTSSKFTSFMERASFTDAFAMNRRLGVGLTFSDKKTDSWILQMGLFNQPINEGANFNRTGWEADVRGVYSPMLGSTRLHLGASVHYRVNNRDAQNERLRARPLTQITDQRLVDTNTISADSDWTAGVELAAIHKSLHVAGEFQKIWIDSYKPGTVFGPNNGTGGGALLNGNPSFWSAYGEVGFYLTGETRGYKGGKFDRTKVLHPFNDGGWGALQINGRVEVLELRDRVDNSSSSIAAPFYVNGGKHVAYQGSLIWNPTDYIRFMAQYAHIDVTGGPRPVDLLYGSPPDPAPTTPLNKRKYSVDMAGVRAQVDF